MVFHFLFDAKVKRLYIYFLSLIISYLPLIFIENEKKFKDVKKFNKIIRATSKIFVIIPYFIIKKYYTKNKRKYHIKNTKNDIIILFIFPIIYLLSEIMNSFFNELNELVNQAIILIFLSFFMKYYTNFHFHKHNILAVILFSLITIIIDLFIYKNYSYVFSTIILNAIHCLFYSIDLNYRKYLMDDRYIPPYKILSFCGLVDLIYFFVIKILSDKYGNFIYCNGNQKKIISSFEGIETNIMILMLESLLIFVCYTIHITIFYLLIYNFTVAHAVVIDTIKISIQEIYIYEIKNKTLLLIFIILMIFGIFILFIYLEIIELKFCGLDKDIRKNILQREEMDIKMSRLQIEMEMDKEDNEIDIGSGYIFEFNNPSNNKINNI